MQRANGRLLTVGLAGAMAFGIGGCAAHPSVETGPENVYLSLDCHGGPSDRIHVIRREGAKVLFAHIYNAFLDEERSLAVGPDGFAIDAPVEPSTHWVSIPAAGNRIGAIAALPDNDQNGILFISGEQMPLSNGAARWTSSTQAVTLACEGDESNLYGNFVPING